MNRSNLITMTGRIDEKSGVSSYYPRGIPHRLDMLNVSNNKDYEHYYHPVATQCFDSDDMEAVLPKDLALPYLTDRYSINSTDIPPAVSPPPSSDSMMSPLGHSSGLLEGFPEISFREVNRDEISSFRKVMASRKYDELRLYRDEGAHQAKPIRLPVVELRPESVEHNTREVTVEAPRAKQLSNVRWSMTDTSHDRHGQDGEDNSPASLYSLRGKSERILPEDFIPGEWSIVIGKDKKSLESSGNQKLRVIVRLFLHKYATCGLYQRNYKSAIISEIISTMLNGHGHELPGAIVRYKNGRWYDVGIGFAREKISRMLREFLHTQYKSSSKQKRQKLRRRPREDEEE